MSENEDVLPASAVVKIVSIVIVAIILGLTAWAGTTLYANDKKLATMEVKIENIDKNIADIKNDIKDLNNRRTLTLQK